MLNLLLFFTCAAIAAKLGASCAPLHRGEKDLRRPDDHKNNYMSFSGGDSDQAADASEIKCDLDRKVHQLELPLPEV